MRKKQPLIVSLVSLILLGSTAFSQAQAQTKEMTKTAPAKQAKVKILKKEGDAYYLLDTTLTVAEGMSYEEAVKKLKTDSISFKSLGARTIKPVQIGTKTLDVAQLFPTSDSDSLRATVFRTIVADTSFARGKHVRVYRTGTMGTDSVKTISILRSPTDTSFSRIKRVRVFGPRTIEVDSLNGTAAGAITIYGDPTIVHRAIMLDSLTKHQRFFRVDSATQLDADSFFLQETIRVVKDSTTGEIRITRKNTTGKEEVLETGNYNVIRFRNPDQNRILIFKATRVATPAETKETLKASKKSRKKVAEPGEPLDLQFFPNPSSGEVNLSFFSKKKAKASLRVVDSQGKTVYEEDLGTVQGQFSKQLNLHKYGKGMYFIQLLIGKTAQSGKVLVQ